jgi:hypothetical protein
MNIHDAPGEHKVTCSVCNKRMKLQRRVSAPALGRGHEYQYWECVCGNVRVIATVVTERPNAEKA